MCDAGDVDLVVCTTVVFTHYDLIKPAIERGKDVFVEWPLCATTREAEELAQLAKERGVRTVIGLQAQAGQLHSTLREVLDSGVIGRVLASHIVGSSTTPETGRRLDKRYLYFNEPHVEGVKGQATLIIYAGHTMEFVASLLGEPKTVSAVLGTTWPYFDLVDGDQVVESQVKKVTNDYASLHGVTDTGVKYTFVLRGGDAFQPEDGLLWDIMGEKGQIRVTGASMLFNLGADNYKVQIKDYATGTIRTVPLHDRLPLSLYAQNIGMVYERFANGSAVPTFEDAVRRHRFLDSMFTSDENNGAVQNMS
jgi:predicted dehydrogenase